MLATVATANIKNVQIKKYSVFVLVGSSRSYTISLPSPFIGYLMGYRMSIGSLDHHGRPIGLIAFIFFLCGISFDLFWNLTSLYDVLQV